MNLIFFSRREGKARHLNLSHPLTMTLIGIGALAVLAGVFSAGLKLGLKGGSLGGMGGPEAISQERSELAIFSWEVFFDLLRTNVVLTKALLAAFSRRLRRANSTIEGLAALDVKSRLARYFRELAAARGKKAGGGWAVVVRPSQREIADTIGSSRETVSRTMSQMAEQQLIVPKGRVVYVRLDAGEAPAPGGRAPATAG